MAHETPEEINARLLGRVLDLERELAEMQTRVSMGKPELPSVDEIRRVRHAAYNALVAHARGLDDDNAATTIAGDFLRVFNALLAAAKR